jgi:hypothetical protein
MKKIIEIEINLKEHELHVLTNARGDTFSFNPTKGVGEELDSFFQGAKTHELPNGKCLKLDLKVKSNLCQ